MSRRFPTINVHGGFCCGIRHLTLFGDSKYSSDKRRTSVFKEIEAGFGCFRKDEYGQGHGKVIEVTLTDDEIEDNPNLLVLLKEKKFELRSRFRNTSGSIVNVFHMATNHFLSTDPKDLPFQW